MVRKVLMADVSGRRVLGRPRLGWMNGVKMALSRREMTVEAARQCEKDRKEWRALVHMEMIECNMVIFCMDLCSFGPPSNALVDYHLVRGGMPSHDAVVVNRKRSSTTENQGAGV